MANLILICGKLCSGKSTYSKKLILTQKAVRLNPDELILTLYGEYLGEKHDEVLGKTIRYLYSKALEMLSADINVILDFGFWQRHYRDEANLFFSSHGVHPEWHYVDVTDETWMRNISKRNAAVLKGEAIDYFIDEGIISKFLDPSDKPSPNEIDIWYYNNWF